MASSKWNRRWLYDSKVKVPKTTRWRRKLDYGGPVTEHGNGDLADEGDISSIIGGLRNDTSPFKKQKLLDDCLTDDKNDDHFSCNEESQTAQPDNETPSAKYIFHNMSIDCKGKDEKEDAETIVVLPHISNISEDSLSPDIWQNIVCDDDFDNDYCGKEQNDRELELSQFHEGPLFDNVVVTDQIPDMTFFKEPSSECQEETVVDGLPLYQDAPVTVAESCLLLMAFAVRHKLSGTALEDLLELVCFHCPKPNKCITELKEFQLFFQALKHPVIKHFYCSNTICKVYIGTSQPASGAKCPVCGTIVSCSSYFIEIPIEEQLKTILSGEDMIDKLQYRFQRSKIDANAIEDVYDGELYKQHSCPGGFLSDPHNISFLGNTDGVALIRSNGYGVWPVYLVINEIPPAQRFRRSNRIFAGLWFGKGKPHFPTFLRPFSLSLRELYHKGVSVTDSVIIKAIVLDMSVDAPARAMWQAVKQYNGYCGCGHCKETGEHLDLGPGKGNRRRMCHVYPFNKTFAATTGHAGKRKHEEVKQQALEALRQRKQGKKNFAVEGVVGLSWGFGLPLHDVIRGTVVDYMHCVCEGVVDQLIAQWLNKSNSKQSFYLGSKVEEISKELTAVTPTSEITRTPRSLSDIKDWKASEKRAFLLYYATPLLSRYLPSDHHLFLMLLTGGMFRLLKQSISQEELHEAHTYLRLFTAQAPIFFGKQFQTFNVHQLLHLPEVVKDLGPLWSNSCFPFEDYNGDLRELFHGTKNVDGQIVTAVSIIQKLPEIARSTTTTPEVKAFYEQLTNKRYNARSTKESIAETAHVVGALERVWSNSVLITKDQLATLPADHGKIWVFRRCLIAGVLFHSMSYKRVVARNDYTIEFQHQDNKLFGSIHTYAKVEKKCQKALCDDRKCSCYLPSHYLAIVEILDQADHQLPRYRDRTVINHITRVKKSGRLLAVPVLNVIQKYLRVDVSSGSYICQLPNPYEKD